jgi:hypothetical protein
MIVALCLIIIVGAPQVQAPAQSCINWDLTPCFHDQLETDSKNNDPVRQAQRRAYAQHSRTLGELDRVSPEAHTKRSRSV